MKTLIISAGHNPSARGAHWQNSYEYDHTSIWVNRIANNLINRGVKVVQIPTGRLTDKVRNVNKTAVSEPSIAVELHFNSAGKTYVEGNETLFYPGSKKGKRIAKEFNESFMQSARPFVKKDRGVKEGWYKMDRPGIVDFYGDKDGDEMPDYFLRKTACPALILEPCFMCQLPDIGDDWERVADSIADALYAILS